MEQLWIATHHHLLLALEYFDVRIMAGATSKGDYQGQATPLLRPGPIWEALRQLASRSRKNRLCSDFPDGRSVTAGGFWTRLEDQDKQWLRRPMPKAVTEVMVRAMQRRADKPEG